jgi:hypothetical protein
VQTSATKTRTGTLTKPGVAGGVKGVDKEEGLDDPPEELLERKALVGVKEPGVKGPGVKEPGVIEEGDELVVGRGCRLEELLLLLLLLLFLLLLFILLVFGLFILLVFVLLILLVLVFVGLDTELLLLLLLLVFVLF